VSSSDDQHVNVREDENVTLIRDKMAEGRGEGR
jgi:hypothetical protein